VLSAYELRPRMGATATRRFAAILPAFAGTAAMGILTAVNVHLARGEVKGPSGGTQFRRSQGPASRWGFEARRASRMK
jgi:hypothetical protein